MFTGSMVALVTPMQADGSICWESLDNLIEFHIENGTDAIVAVGTTGESATLTVEEHTDVIKFTVDKVNKRIPVIAGTGANSTAEAIHLTQAAKNAGANAVLLVTPYYNKPTQEGLYQHYVAVAEAVDIPQLLYNVPARTACDMLPETIIRLANIKNIVGVKEATGDISRVTEIVAKTDSDFVVLSGDDATSLDLIKAGGVGTISVTANVSPKALSSMIKAGLEKDFELAERLQNLLMPLHDNLFLEANPIPVKWAMNYMGLIPSGIRLPLTEFSEQYHANVSKALAESGVI